MGNVDQFKVKHIRTNIIYDGVLRINEKRSHPNHARYELLLCQPGTNILCKIVSYPDFSYERIKKPLLKRGEKRLLIKKYMKYFISKIINKLTKCQCDHGYMAFVDGYGYTHSVPCNHCKKGESYVNG